jgi:hypothetical protein
MIIGSGFESALLVYGISSVINFAVGGATDNSGVAGEIDE